MIYALILLAVVCRLVPHPWNFTPVLAIALLGGALLPRRAALAVPLVAMLLSDLALWYLHGPLYAFGPMRLVVYGCFLAAVGLGMLLREKRTWGRTLGAALAGSVLFFVVTNFAVWARSGMYPPTLEGLYACYVMALPFFRNALAGDVVWTATLFGLYELALARARSRASAGLEQAG